MRLPGMVQRLFSLKILSGAVLMAISKEFCHTSHYLVKTKLHENGLSLDTTTFLNIYLDE